MAESNNKRLVKNTMFLYIRMFLTLAVSLYTSRVVLDVLGVEDFGLYNVVGGVVAMLSFLNNALSGATSRFLSYELGRNNQEMLTKTFKTIFSVHILLAVFMLIVLEVFGYWFVLNKLSVPDGRMDAAIFVFHFSVFACIVHIIRLPFNAAIISHERMDVFAYISIVEVLLKLGIVYLLLISDFDKLEFYAILTFGVTTFVSVLFVFFAKTRFPECKMKFGIDKQIATPVLSFSGWDLYGNLSVVVRGQGLNILQNTFFGTVVNAATGISNQVLTAIMGFAENFMVAVKPQIVKYYASNDLIRFRQLILNSSRYCTLLLFFISFPIFLESKFILGIWLINPPDYASQFCQLAIINNWISIMYRPVVYGIHATGNAKRISLINGSIYLSVLPLSYVMLKAGGSPIVPFVLNIVLLFIGQTFFTLPTIKHYVPSFSIKNFLGKSMLKCLFAGGVSAVVPVFVHNSLNEGWARLLVCSLSSVVLTPLFSYFLAVEKDDRKKIIPFVMGKFKRKKV